MKSLGQNERDVTLQHANWKGSCFRKPQAPIGFSWGNDYSLTSSSYLLLVNYKITVGVLQWEKDLIKAKEDAKKPENTSEIGPSALSVCKKDVVHGKGCKIIGWISVVSIRKGRGYSAVIVCSYINICQLLAFLMLDFCIPSSFSQSIRLLLFLTSLRIFKGVCCIDCIWNKAQGFLKSFKEF